jgi:glycosyltransferase involved in cell wall biosynthesis
MNPLKSKADLHIHSRHSTRAADWVLRRLEFPASYSDPLQLYKRLREIGMDFVTITDHNTIAGCLEVAHLPSVIFGEEVTANFPDDECKVHILIWGLTETQHREIQMRRDNVFELQRYLAEQSLAHAVAHPLHSPDEKLTPLHFQKLALIFRHFEGTNGRYHARLSDAVRYALQSLTPSSIEAFVARTGIEPTHDEPWRKIFIGGSDDHGGVYPARAWTEVPLSQAEADFLANVREGNCEAAGEGGTPLALAHGTYSTAFHYLKAKFSMQGNDAGAGLIEKAFSRFMEGRNPTEFSLAEKLAFLAQGIATGKIFEIAMAGNTTLWKELSTYFSKPEVKAALARETAGVAEPERRAFLMANLIAGQLGYRFVTQFIAQLSSARFIESIQVISPLVLIAAMLSPYIHAFRQPRREWLREMTRVVGGTAPAFLGNEKRAWFTDTLDDVNGVATTIQKMAAAGVAAGHDITVITCQSGEINGSIPLKNFQPVGEFALPEYELQRLSFPPLLFLIEHLARENYSELIISTPGPVGLCALCAAKTLGLRAVGIYHTDFPQYVRILTDDSFLETLTWNYMHWFYSQLDIVYVNSQDYRRSWIERGIPAEKLKILPRGLDTRMFHPTRRDARFWQVRGLREDEVGMLFVGRISKEKNLDTLVASTRRLAEWKLPVRPLFVGDGPYLAEMKRLLPDALFTGYLRGEELADAYASADFFVFPSTTDTFGNVVLEAQASGLPVIVSDMGGPRDLVQHGRDGFITKALDSGELAEAIRRLTEDPRLRERMGLLARGRVETRDWSEAFETFWHASP